MAERVQEQGLSDGMSELSKEHGEAVGGRRVKMARPDGVAQFRGVSRKPSGRYAAQIWVPSRRGKVSLGTVATAEEAAKAYDAAAGELLASTPGSAANKRKTKKKTAAARWGALTEFRGIFRTGESKYGARITHCNTRYWLGTFRTAEDAARAYDAKAVELHGAMALTNFKQPSEDKDTTAETMAVKEESAMELLDFPEMPAVDFLSHGSMSGERPDDLWAGLPSAERSDDLWAGLPPAERQLVDDFLKDTDLSDVTP